jgi:ABC-type branched-subunit amino acid transport system substrate-binding protein
MSIQGSSGPTASRLRALGTRALSALRRPIGRFGPLVLTLVLGGIIGALISLPIQDWWNHTKADPFVAVILSNDDPNFTIPMELKQGIQQAMNSRPSIETPNQQSVGIQFVQTALTPDDTADAVRKKCLQIPACIAIVGASDSTTTTAALKEILKFQGQKPALIMPIATATSLTDVAAIGHFSQILRLVPNNNEQAQEIKSFIASRARTQKVTVIIDPNNPDYSTNLARLIVQMISDNGGDANTLDYRDSSTLADANLHLASQDFLVFVGTSSNGLEIIKDMKRLNIRVPTIFTDGNTVKEVIDSSIGMPGPAYFLTPVRELNNFKEPGYTAIGRDTYAILSSIFSQSPGLSRSAVADFISNRKYDIVLTSGAAGSYKFGQDGENSAMRFSIFSIQKSKVVIQKNF